MDNIYYRRGRKLNGLWQKNQQGWARLHGIRDIDYYCKRGVNRDDGLFNAFNKCGA